MGREPCEARNFSCVSHNILMNFSWSEPRVRPVAQGNSSNIPETYHLTSAAEDLSDEINFEIKLKIRVIIGTFIRDWNQVSIAALMIFNGVWSISGDFEWHLNMFEGFQMIPCWFVIILNPLTCFQWGATSGVG